MVEQYWAWDRFLTIFFIPVYLDIFLLCEINTPCCICFPNVPPLKQLLFFQSWWKSILDILWENAVLGIVYLSVSFVPGSVCCSSALCLFFIFKYLDSSIYMVYIYTYKTWILSVCLSDWLYQANISGTRIESQRCCGLVCGSNPPWKKGNISK